jgi:hypothetical protein
MNTNKTLLFVDLDEVLITRLSISSHEETIVMIQPVAQKKLNDLLGQFLFLTHRTRKEALQIVNKIFGFQRLADDVIAAEDIIRAAILTGQIFSLLRYGIQKRLILRAAERKYGIEPRRLAILDDSPANVDGILAGGGGLGLLAPKPQITDGEVATFNFDTVLAKYESFRNGEIFEQQRILLAADKKYPLSRLETFHLIQAHPINYFRRGANIFRSAVFRK